MSKSKLDSIEQRLSSKRQKTPLESDSIDHDHKKEKRSHYETLTNNKTDYSHFD